MVELPPLVTVIIPVFNRIDYIDQTVRCVLEQTYPNVELIVIDDGSTDGSYKQLLSYGERISLLTHYDHGNCGQAASINLGLKAARGDYIAILDSDDYWSLNKLAVQVAFLQVNHEYDVVYVNGYHVNAEGELLHQFHDDDHVEENDPNRVLLDCYMLLPQNALVRKSVYQRVGLFNESYRAAQDHDMLIRIAEVSRMAYIPEYLFFYRRHGASISSNGQKLRWENGFKILAKAKQRYPYKPSTIRKRLAVLNFRMAQVCIKKKQFFKALPFLIKSGFLDPVRACNVLLGNERVNG